MDAKTFLSSVGAPPDSLNFETGEGYITIAPKDFGLLGNLMLSPTKFPRQFVKVLPYTGIHEKSVTEVIKGVEVEFCDGPNYLVVGAPLNPQGFKYLRICGDFAAWSRTNSAPF